VNLRQGSADKVFGPPPTNLRGGGTISAQPRAPATALFSSRLQGFLPESSSPRFSEIENLLA